MFENKIRLYADGCHPHSKKLIKQMGVPPKDKKYIFLAISAAATIIFSNDIDMYEPKAKGWSAAKRAKIKSVGGGTVGTWLRDNHNIRVCQFTQYREFFCGMSIGSIPTPIFVMNSCNSNATGCAIALCAFTTR